MIHNEERWGMEMKQKIRIELLSDLCVSSGDVFNSLIDTDVCSDEYGIPYIPAKRIKGCLREAAQELCDWGAEIKPEELFGQGGDCTGKVTLGNAYPENYDSYIQEIREAGESLLVHPQLVKEHFCYLRTQTAIHYDSGVADDNSLRTIRVIKKNNVFEAEVNVQEEYCEGLEQCCHALHYMGMGRTRGLGHIKVTLLPVQDEKPDGSDGGSSKENQEDSNKIPSLNLPEGRYRLDYTIRLKAPLICKSVTNDQEASEDYISGSKILGMIAGFVSQDKDKDTDTIFDGLFQHGGRPACKGEELICSNAYLSIEDHRFVPVAASVYTVKNHDSDGRDKMLMCGDGETEKGIQLNQARGFFVDANTGKNRRKAGVRMEQRYHHSRPADKSIGHVVVSQEGSPAGQSIGYNAAGQKESINGGKFYQIESICPGQSFSGYIFGNNKQIDKIYQYFQKNQKMRMGYNRSAEYGEVEICAKMPEKINVPPASKVKRFAIKFESPVIEYNENGMYSTEAEIIQEEIAQIFNPPADGLEIEKRFLSYTVLGGYNTTWRERKPTISAIDRGSVLVFSVKDSEGVDLSVLQGAFLGERVAEGYGEISVIPDMGEAETYEIQIEKAESSKEQAEEGNITTCLLKEIVTSQFQKYVDYYAREKARKDYDELKKKYDMRNIRPTVSNMLLICEECFLLKNEEGLDRWKTEDKLDNEKKELDRSKKAALEEAVAKRFTKGSDGRVETDGQEQVQKKVGTKGEKYDIAMEMIESYENETGEKKACKGETGDGKQTRVSKIWRSFCEKYQWKEEIMLEFFQPYMKAYLEEMKYKCRESKMES